MIWQPWVPLCSLVLSLGCTWGGSFFPVSLWSHKFTVGHTCSVSLGTVAHHFTDGVPSAIKAARMAVLSWFWVCFFYWWDLPPPPPPRVPAAYKGSRAGFNCYLWNDVAYFWQHLHWKFGHQWSLVLPNKAWNALSAAVLFEGFYWCEVGGRRGTWLMTSRELLALTSLFARKLLYNSAAPSAC